MILSCRNLQAKQHTLTVRLLFGRLFGPSFDSIPSFAQDPSAKILHWGGASEKCLSLRDLAGLAPVRGISLGPFRAERARLSWSSRKGDLPLIHPGSKQIPLETQPWRSYHTSMSRVLSMKDGVRESPHGSKKVRFKELDPEMKSFLRDRRRLRSALIEDLKNHSHKSEPKKKEGQAGQRAGGQLGGRQRTACGTTYGEHSSEIKHPHLYEIGIPGPQPVGIECLERVASLVSRPNDAAGMLETVYQFCQRSLTRWGGRSDATIVAHF